MDDIIYVDILVFENLFMNYLLLYIINRFCKCKAKSWRLGIASLIGALYVVVLFFPDLSIFYSVVMKFMMSMVMIVVAFSPYKFRDFAKILILFYIEAFLVAGCIFALFFITNHNIEVIDGAFLMKSISSTNIIVGSIVAIVLVKLGFDYFENYYAAEKNRVELNIFLNDRHCSIKALIDTGNSLKDPISNMPVVVAYTQAIASILPEEIKDIVLKCNDYNFITKQLLNSSLKSRIRVIPYKALGIENGMLTGIRVDMITTRFQSKTNIIKEAVVALYDKPISSQGDYDALAYPEILK
jgi:stage II sporulation protein GA (sporulation sigma-E factor processing peptidase)